MAWCRGAALECKTASSPRRCGGQGDILAGAVATFAAWASNVAPYVLAIPCRAPRTSESDADASSRSNEVTLPPMLDACHAACQLVRHASLAAFTKHKRATTAVEVLQEVGPSFYELYDKLLEQESAS